MTFHHQDTLESIYAHPLRHNIRWEHLVGLWHELGGEINHLDQQRFRLRLPDGSETWMHHTVGRQHAVLQADDVLRVRHLLQAAGISPEQPIAAPAPARGDQGRRLVIRLDHRGADLYWLEGDAIEHATLHPHGSWAGDQNLSHRHDRDVAGQRAPTDHAYLARLCDSMASADTVLLLGHGHGEANLMQILREYVGRHRPDLLERIGACELVDDSALSEGQLLAHARRHFGNLPHRRSLRHPGQATRAGLERDNQ